MALKELSDGGPDGSRLGQSSTDKVGFFGTTPVVRPTAASAVVSTAITAVASTAPTSTNPFGFTTSTQAAAIVTAVNSLITQSAESAVAANTTTTNMNTLGLQG